MFVSYLQNMNTSGFRTCFKKLYETSYNPVSISYVAVAGTKMVFFFLPLAVKSDINLCRY